VNGDILFRGAACGLALVLALAPYRAAIWAAANRVVEAAKEKAGFLGRIAAIGLLIAAAWGKVPLPSLPAVAPVAFPAVETPSDEMQRLVTPIADALQGASDVDRALWAETWNKCALVVAGDAIAKDVAFTDTRSLRLFTTLALDIAWRRIGRHVPGSQESLRIALEAAYGQAIGTTVSPVTQDVRERYAAFAKAVAWAGRNRG
jgi:hypothetical protein